MLIKENWLAARTAGIEFRQFNPDVTFAVDAGRNRGGPQGGGGGDLSPMLGGPNPCLIAVRHAPGMPVGVDGGR